MKPHRPTPTAPPMVTGLLLFFAVAPLVVVFGLFTDDPAFFNFSALVISLIGIGCLIYGANAFFTAFDALAARYLADDRPAPGSAQPAGPSYAYPPSAPGPTAPVGPLAQAAPAAETDAPSSSAAAASPRPAPKPLPPTVDGEDSFRPKMPPLPTPQPKE